MAPPPVGTVRRVSTTFRISYGNINRRLLGLLGLGPGRSSLVVGDGTVEVTMGWGFRTSFPRSAVESVEPDDDRVWGWGVHGWRDRWLVNGSSDGMVRITLASAVPARICFVPWRVSTLRISLDEPEQVVAMLAS